LYYPIDPATGTYQYFTLVTENNPRAQLDLFRSQNRQQRLLNNVWAEVKFLKDFTFRSSLTNDNLNSNLYEYTPAITYIPQPSQSSLVTRDSRNRDYVWDTTLNWKRAFGDHNLDVLAGYSQTQNYYNQVYRSAANVNYDGTNGSLDIGNGTNAFEVNMYDVVRNVVPTLSRIQSVFGRINYDYQGRYLINGSIRRDGSSNFSENRNEVFPSVSAGWVVSKESFMGDQNIFSLLKLRGSWGRTGNPNVPPGQYDLFITNINAGAYYGSTGSPATTIDQIVDNSISWEITTGKDFGVEMAFLNNSLKLEATYFDKDTKDVVYGVVQGTVSGASNWASYVTNAFSFNNKGFELSLNYDKKLSEKVRIGFYGNFTSLKNEITSVFGGSYANAGASLFGNQII
ncbi:MAG: TonB-dependent receptor, partial [Chryseobacterium sp.]|nr:TonB-dependent receptor [Chryseobacterium sp.]